MNTPSRLLAGIVLVGLAASVTSAGPGPGPGPGGPGRRPGPSPSPRVNPGSVPRVNPGPAPKVPDVPKLPGGLDPTSAAKKAATPRPGERPSPAQSKSIEEHLRIARDAAPAALSEALNLYSADSAPFTPQWYAQHPEAWKATHPHADAWVAATATGLATWLAIPAVTTTGTTGGEETVAGGVVVAGEAPAESSNASSSSDADQLAAAGSDETEADAEWMTIGIYSLLDGGQSDATRMIRLEVSRDGVIRGSYSDLISGSAETVKGAVDRETQKVAWSVGTNSEVVFQTTLSELTKAKGKVTAHFPSGKKNTWRMVVAKSS